MKKITFFIIFMLGGILLFGQKKVLEYTFENTLAEKKDNGPALQMLDSAGVFVLDTLNEINYRTKIVYRFKKNCGVQFKNALANNFLSQTYSIELYFVFDELSSWKRVIDWKNQTSDDGAYIYYGQLNFYPWVYSDTAFVTAGEYTYYVITRDSATMRVNMYTDNKLGATFIDNTEDAVLDTTDVLNFFRDDLQVQDEASSGAIALLNIYNYVLDSNTIKNNFNNLQGEIFSVQDKKKQRNINIYPNPASDNLIIDLHPLYETATVLVSLYNFTGTLIYSNRFDANRLVSIDLNSLNCAPGIYMMKAETDSGVCTKRIVIRR